MRTVIGYCHREMSPTSFATQLLMVYAQVPEVQVGGVIGVPYRHDLDVARTEIAEAFVASPFDRLLMVDTDVVFTPEDVSRILESDYDITAGVYMNSLEGIDAADLDGNQIVTVPDKPMPVYFSGTGFMLIHRRVFETMREGWFNRILINRKRVYEDESFCVKARQAGFEIILDPSVVLGHYKLTNITPAGLI